MLLGADVASQLLLEKHISRGSVAWKTELGWVLSGPQTKTASQHSDKEVEAVVSFVSAHGSSPDEHVQTLFELESPIVKKRRTDPAFSLVNVVSNASHKTGWPWKETARPGDNESQAYALAKSQIARVDREGCRHASDEDSLQGFNKLDAFEHEYDCVSSLNVDEEMETFCTLSSRIMVKAGMELRKVRSDALCPGNDKPLRGPTVLVVSWDPTSDTLPVCLQAGDDEGYATRTRSLLLRMAEAHFETGRVLMQLAWRETTECDKIFSSSRSLSARVSAWAWFLSDRSRREW